MLYAFFWVFPRRLNFICQRFGTHCLSHLHRCVGTKISSYLPAYDDGTDSVPKRRRVKLRCWGNTQKYA